MPADTPAINIAADDLVRIYCDISPDAEMKMRLRCIQIQQETGERMTRKTYIERLIADDVAKVAGASLREINSRRR